jgi:phage anti-repressor protein
MYELEASINTQTMTPIEVALRMDKDGYVSAKNLYAFLELDETHYSRWCKTSIEENAFAAENQDYEVLAIRGENPQGGRPTKDYRLTAAFAKKLAMQAGGERGEQARCYFIACEQALVQIAKEKQQWEIERAKGVVIRHILTDTIKMKIADSPNKRFAYPNYTKLIYQTIFGKPIKELQDGYGVKPKESLRDYLTAEQLKEVEAVEMLVSSLINLGMGYQEIKDFLAARYTKQLAA